MRKRTGKDEYSIWWERPSEGKGTERNRKDEYLPWWETFHGKQKEKTAIRKVCTRKHWPKFTLIYTFVLRFLENIERLKTPLENVILQLESWNVLNSCRRLVLSNLYSAANDPRPQTIPKLDRKWSRTEMIPDVDRKWSRQKAKNGMEFVPLVVVSIFNPNRSKS